MYIAGRQTVHCPECAEEVPKAALLPRPYARASNVRPSLIYKCPRCGEVTLIENLVRKTHKPVQFGGGEPDLNEQQVIDIIENYFRTRLKRTNPMMTVPTAARNTFAGSTVEAIPPSLNFWSAGSVAETNKIYEVGFERVDFTSSPFAFPTYYARGATNGPSDHTHIYRCQLYGESSVAANLDSTAFVGVEMYSSAQNVLTATAASAVHRVEQRLDDRSQWRVTFNDGNGGVNLVRNFTVEVSNGIVGGAHVEVVYDPFGLTIKTYVDYVLRNTESLSGFNGTFFGHDIAFGGLVYSGTQTGATVIAAQWGAIEVVSVNTGLFGSGLV